MYLQLAFKVSIYPVIWDSGAQTAVGAPEIVFLLILAFE
jgi:hypothetical protein